MMMQHKKNLVRNASIGVMLSRLLACPAIGLGQRTETSGLHTDVLATLRAGHPRLYVLDSDLAQVKQAMAEGRGRPNQQAAALLLLVCKFPDTLDRLEELPAG
jgi:hypothetical protein